MGTPAPFPGTLVPHPAVEADVTLDLVGAADVDRLRVLWVINGLGAGGAERLLCSAARVADHERFDYEAAYVLQRKTALVADLVAHGVRVHALDGRRRVEPGWPLRLRRLLVDGRYDVLHLHSPLVAGVARALVRTLPPGRRPVVVSTEHNEWSSFRLPTRVVNAALYRHDAAKWAVSDEVRRSIWRPLRGDVEVVVHGVVLADLARDGRAGHDVRREIGAARDDIVVGTVANYRAQKAYPDLLLAARQVLDRNSHVRFVAVGQGPLEAEVKRLHERLRLGARFVHLGQRDDVPRLLNGFDVFVLASHYEGFPVSVMEALGAGLPVVVTGVGGLRGTVVDGVHGRVVPPAAPVRLAEAVLDLAGDRDLRLRCGTAAEQLGRRFDIGHAVRQIERTYLEVARTAPDRAEVGRVA